MKNISGWMEIFRSGTHTSMEGNTTEYSEDDLDNIVSLYNEQPDEAKHIAPIVIGHPTTESPSYGWIEKLRRVGDIIEGFANQVDEDFAELVNAGRYERRSIALDENNLLVHVGFLGAVPPAVKGLAKVSFSSYGNGLRMFNDGAITPVSLVAQEVAPDVVTPEVAQELRATKFGITAKNVTPEEINRTATKQGNIVKPEAYTDLTDEQFGDPVNYRFPLHDKANILMSIELFGTWDMREQYSIEERQIIGSRIIAAAESNGINPDTRPRWNFASIKRTLVGFSTNNFSGGFSMDLSAFIEWLNATYGAETAQQTKAYIDQQNQAALQALNDFVAQTFGAEVGTAAAAKLAEIANPAPVATQTNADTGTGTGTVTGTGTAGETSMSESTVHRLTVIEERLLNNDLETFCAGLEKEGRLFVSEREQNIKRLRDAFASDKAGVTTGSYDDRRKEFSERPVRFAKDSFATNSRSSESKVAGLTIPNGMSVDEDSVKQSKAIEEYAAKNNMSYSQAYSVMNKKGLL